MTLPSGGAVDFAEPARDAIDIEEGLASDRPGEPIEDAFLRVLARTRSPGLARLYTAFAAEATDPQHPAHDFFKERASRSDARSPSACGPECGRDRAAPSAEDHLSVARAGWSSQA